jgi:hypothetical protein
MSRLKRNGTPPALHLTVGFRQLSHHLRSVRALLAGFVGVTLFLSARRSPRSGEIRPDARPPIPYRLVRGLVARQPHRLPFNLHARTSEDLQVHGHSLFLGHRQTNCEASKRLTCCVQPSQLELVQRKGSTRSPCSLIPWLPLARKKDQATECAVERTMVPSSIMEDSFVFGAIIRRVGTFLKVL